MKLTLYKKLLCSFVIVLLLLSAISVTAMTEMGNMGQKSKLTTDKGLPGLILLGNLNHDLMELDDLMLRIQLDIQENNNLNAAMTGSSGDSPASQSDKAKAVFDNIQNKLKHLDQLSTNEKDANLIRLFHQRWDAYAAAFPAILVAVQQHGPQGLQLIQEANANISGCAIILDMLTRNVAGHAQDWGQELTDSYRSGAAWVIGLSITAIVAGLAISFLIARHVSKPIRRISSIAHRVSGGDLSVKDLTLKRRDEIGDLSAAFALMTSHMRSMLLKINEHAGLVTASADQLRASSGEMQSSSRHIAETVKDVAEGAGQQTLSMEETSRSMEEVGSGIGRLAESASTIAETVELSRQHAEHGGVSVQSTADQMQSIESSVIETDHSIALLEAKSQQIGSIVAAIQDIAQQTNLLALNAAIEAARAGEQGRGFAVVASEVRKLAEQSGSSSEEIASLLSEIEAGIRQSGDAMAQVKLQVQTGLERVRETEHHFDQILHSTISISSQVQEMAATSEQMSAGAQQITASVQQVASIARQSAAASQQVAASVAGQLQTTDEVQTSARSLSQMTEELHQLLTQFKVS